MVELLDGGEERVEVDEDRWLDPPMWEVRAFGRM